MVDLLKHCVEGLGAQGINTNNCSFWWMTHCFNAAVFNTTIIKMIVCVFVLQVGEFSWKNNKKKNTMSIVIVRHTHIWWSRVRLLTPIIFIIQSNKKIAVVCGSSTEEFLMRTHVNSQFRHYNTTVNRLIKYPAYFNLFICSSFIYLQEKEC